MRQRRLESDAENRCRHGRSRRNHSSLRQRILESDAEPVPQRLRQAELFFFAAANIRIGRGTRATTTAAGGPIYLPHDGAASIPDFSIEIKNRCSSRVKSRENPASIRKSKPEIKNRCTQEGLNREILASIPKSGLEIKNHCTQEGK